MPKDYKAGIQIYATGMSNLVTIMAAGLAASTALMQIVGSDATNRWWYIWSLIAFFFGLISCFVTMTGLTGEIVEDNPNLNGFVRWAALFSFFLACLGFVLLGVGAFKSPEKTDRLDGVQLILKMEACRSDVTVTTDQKARCYDSFFDAQASGLKITEDDLKALSEKDRAWIKVLILKSTPPKK